MTGADGGTDPGAGPGWRRDVALSFAGRAARLRRAGRSGAAGAGVRRFYDAGEQIDLRGKYLAKELPASYAGQAARSCSCLPGMPRGTGPSAGAPGRAGPGGAGTAGGRAAARFDGTPLPGLLPDMVTVALRTRSPRQFAAMIAGTLAALAVVLPATAEVTARDARGGTSRRGGARGDAAISVPGVLSCRYG